LFRETKISEGWEQKTNHHRKLTQASEKNNLKFWERGKKAERTKKKEREKKRDICHGV